MTETPFFTRSQFNRRKRLAKYTKLAHELWNTRREITGDLSDQRDQLIQAMESEQDKKRKFKILLAVIGLEYMDATLLTQID